MPSPVSRVSSAESSTSRGCSAPCDDIDRGGEIERARQLRRDAQRIGRRRRAVFANGEVERVGGDVVLREIRGDVR